MANKSLFSSFRGFLADVPRTDSVNNAGGAAYGRTTEDALAQLALTGCGNSTYYVGAEQQLDEVLALAAKVDARFLAQLAVYARREGFMKDMPALLCAILATRDVEILAEVFPQVIDNGRMVRNFVQIIRSGVTGRKSLGSAPRRLVRQWLTAASDQHLLNASVGQSPSLADVVKMVHPRPVSAERDAFFAWLIGKDYDLAALPSVIREYEAWKESRSGEVPDVPFQMLTALDLGRDEWMEIARNASWQMTRMNLNTFARHGVFEVREMKGLIAKRLADPELIRRARVFPYQLLTAFHAADKKVPGVVLNALQDAMEVAVSNVPKVDGRVAICPDVSGSMHSAVTGYRKGSTSAARCIDIAGLIAAAMLRQNSDALVLPFEAKVQEVRINPRDSVMTNANKLASLPCGGTNCSAPLKWIADKHERVDLVVIVSDNESWIDSPHYGHWGGGATETLKQWQRIKAQSPNAKLVCLDIQPNTHTQAKDRQDIINIGGFSDQVFKLISAFADGSLDGGGQVDQIRNVTINTKEKQQTA